MPEEDIIPTPVPKKREWTLMAPRRVSSRPQRNQSNSSSTQLPARQQQNSDSSQAANTALQTAIMLQFFM